VAVLQIVADRPGAGKTSLAGALLVHLAAAGKRVAYYKPLSQTPDQDPDVSFFSGYPLTGADSSQVPSPQAMPAITGARPRLGEPQAGEIRKTVARLKRQCDSLLLESPDLASPDGEASSLPMELSSLIDSRIVLLFRYSADLDAGEVVGAGHPFGDRLAGVMINGVTAYRSGHVNQTLAPALRAQGIPLLGAVGEDRGMLGVTVQQIADSLGGRWAQEPENGDAPVERFLIGGNIMDAGPTYFGRHSNQAVITRASRPDIQMAGLMAGVRCLVLTGGDEPTEYVKAEAIERSVPLILVESNTLETAEALGGLLDQATAHSRQKIQRFLRLMGQSLDLDSLASSAVG
jgi:hypothetical protein